MQTTAFQTGAQAALRSTQSRQRVLCTALQRAPEGSTSRRSLLALVPLVGLVAVESDAQAVASRWDGESAAIGSCPLGEAGRECREQTLTVDKNSMESYASAIDNSTKVSKTGVNSRVNDKYAADTLAVMDKLRLYTELDPYNPERVQLIKQLKLDGSAWVGKYATGGSARTASGRKVYIAIDAVQGHLASNGLMPYPPSKARKLLQDLEDAKALLDEGR